MFLLRELMVALGSPHLDCRQDGAALDPSCRAGYLFNSTIAGIERADALLLVGTNPRLEAPVLNARIRKRWLAGNFPVGIVGTAADLTYRSQHLGNGPKTLAEIADGRHPFAETLRNAKHPMLILGQGGLARPDGAAVLASARALADSLGLVKDGWNGFNVLHTAAARVGGLDLEFVPKSGGRDVAGILEGASSKAIEVVYLLEADEIDVSKLGDAFVVYQGHHGDKGAHRADVILPGAAYTEKPGIYVNTEGRVQQGHRAVFPLGDAREDWKILRALSEILGKKLPYDSIDAVRSGLAKANPVFAAVDRIVPATWGAFGKAGTFGDAPLASPIRNFYQTDPISRASPTMAKCTALKMAGVERTGTHG
jgi:NADH-quinone oxidoreductase subunit G